MPCWYYDKKELRNTPSARDGIDYITEARYRKEGARFIIDCGTKLGLRYDSCATGVVFFHRFYMFHSFKEFHRYVTAACCLFLAGKTEETPKKCKDLIKTTRSMLTDAQFAVFGEDPKEEVMTLERILLQTIKFDLMVEHPYAYLLKFAKLVKGRGSVADKAKVQKLVQMAWTFINDSMCTTLCLQWEPEVIAVSLMYLATRLNKTEITDWIGKPPGFKGKWWESLVEDVNQELLEDVCHQVLDLYQPSQAVKAGQDETPPQASNRSNTTSSAVTQTAKRPRSPPPTEPSKPRGPVPNKVPRDEKRPVSPARSTNKDHNRALKSSHSLPAASSTKTSHSGPSTPASAPVLPTTTTVSNYSQNNPYMSQQMYSSSFMSQEGSQSIQSLVGGRTTYSGTTNYTQPPTASVPAPPTTSAYSQPPTYQQSSYQGAGYQQPPPQPPNFQQPPPTVTGYSQPNNYSQSYTYPPPTQPAYSGSNQYQTPPPNYNQNYTGQYGTAQQYPANYQYNSQSYQNFAPSQSYQQPQTPQPPPPGMPPHIPPPPRPTTALPSVRITGRPS